MPGVLTLIGPDVNADVMLLACESTKERKFAGLPQIVKVAVTTSTQGELQREVVQLL